MHLPNDMMFTYVPEYIYFIVHDSVLIHISGLDIQLNTDTFLILCQVIRLSLIINLSRNKDINHVNNKLFFIYFFFGNNNYSQEFNQATKSILKDPGNNSKGPHINN